VGCKDFYFLARKFDFGYLTYVYLGVFLQVAVAAYRTSLAYAQETALTVDYFLLDQVLACADYVVCRILFLFDSHYMLVLVLVLLA